MKKIALVVLTGLLFMVSCDMGNIVYDNTGVEFTFENTTEYTVTIYPDDISQFDSFVLRPKSSKDILSSVTNISYKISAINSNDYQIKSIVENRNHKIIQYKNEVSYVIYGTATSVLITLTNTSGDVYQYNNVSLPIRYDYPVFDSKFKSVMAQNKGSTGYVKVEIYNYDKLVNESFNGDPLGIAISSFNK